MARAAATSGTTWPCCSSFCLNRPVDGWSVPCRPRFGPKGPPWRAVPPLPQPTVLFLLPPPWPGIPADPHTPSLHLCSKCPLFRQRPLTLWVSLCGVSIFLVPEPHLQHTQPNVSCPQADSSSSQSFTSKGLPAAPGVAPQGQVLAKPTLSHMHLNIYMK